MKKNYKLNKERIEMKKKLENFSELENDEKIKVWFDALILPRLLNKNKHGEITTSIPNVKIDIPNIIVYQTYKNKKIAYALLKKEKAIIHIIPLGTNKGKEHYMDYRTKHGALIVTRFINNLKKEIKDDMKRIGEMKVEVQGGFYLNSPKSILKWLFMRKS